jgi:hypothetical protein
MPSLLRRLLFDHKNNKLVYYLIGFARELMPGSFFRNRLHKKIQSISHFDEASIKKRVNYYNKLENNKPLSGDAVELKNVEVPRKNKVYYFDTYEYTRYFSPHLKAKLLFGDITHVPTEPSIVKSRPAGGDNANSVLLKLNKVRHYMFVKDTKSFVDKKNMLVGRSVVKVPHRIRFYEMYFNHPLCNLGQINTNKNPQWIKKKMTISEHLDYKFILCLEGYDVATNLKWVMSSNSLAVMPTPKYETWFMEGTLIPNLHYVLIKDDYSDLEERLTYYMEHTEEALQIIKNANEYVNQFRNKKQEDLISLLVLEKYFYRTGQLSPQHASLFQ